MAETLQELHDAAHDMMKALLVVKPTLDQPYSDAPEWTPWSRWIDREANSTFKRLDRALAVARKELRLTEGATHPQRRSGAGDD